MGRNDRHLSTDAWTLGIVVLKITLCTLSLLSTVLQAWAGEAVEFFETRVRPVLANNCFACHTNLRMGNLEMVSAEALRKGGNSGPAIIPGRPEESLLIQAVTHTHPQLKMPPQGLLRPQEIEDLKTWIRSGAVWPSTAGKSADTGSRITAEHLAFWALQPFRNPPLPQVKSQAWVKSPVDAFILARLEREGLQPVRPAEKRVLLRRVYFDLIGLPPTPEEVHAFERDRSPDSFAKVVDRLLASPQYGERWGRHWLDVARYSDDKLNIVADEPYPNAFRYRDWVIQAFNDDMPYDLFVKAQIAADLLTGKDRERLMPALGFYGMSAQYQEDRPDVTGKVFVGLTVGCAQCHDHKYDPIPTRDYYSLLGIFTSTKLQEHPLASAEVVDDYQKRQKEIEELEERLQEFRQTQARQLAEILASRIVRYLPAVWKVLGPPKLSTEEAATQEGLDLETLQRWINYLKKKDHEHPYLNAWNELLVRGGNEEEARTVAVDFQTTVWEIHKEMRWVEEQNLVRLGDAKGNPSLAKIVLLPYPRDKYVFWSSLFGEARTGFTAKREDKVLCYEGEKVDRFLSGQWKEFVEDLSAKLKRKKQELPPKYPFLHVIADKEIPENLKIRIRGNPENLGEEAPRGFLTALSEGKLRPFAKGSGRLELAEAIADPKNPLTARVMVNRIWLHHFGQGIVRTPSNFGQLGERPTHPELLDYLAARFVGSGWSIKAMHRLILLSRTYALSAESRQDNLRVDPGNRLHWRANLRKLDVEALRDSFLATSGRLDSSVGGAPLKMTDEKNVRRTVYCFISRRNLDSTLAMFDFPNANDTNEQRIVTNTPLQRLFFLNNDFVMRQAEMLAERVAKESGPKGHIRYAYRLLFGRDPSPRELEWGWKFLAGNSWPSYAQALYASNEFQFVN